jgi:muramoyltetrapeptide carboxypeptidase LdcA involved in peptidoglycan recycling
MTIRYPAALRPGDIIGVTAPSSGVEQALLPRLAFCVETLRSRGYEVRLGSCMDGAGVVSAPAEQRAAELTAMLVDPSVRAVVPPWGGALAVEVLPHLDFTAIAQAVPTWFVGFSDNSTLLLPLTTLTGTATLYGQNLMDTPYRVPAPLLSWVEVASQSEGSTVSQGASAMHRTLGFDRWEDDPTFAEYTLDTVGTWRPLEPEQGEVRASGRLIGGCIETISILAGTRFGDLGKFADDHAPEGLMIYLDPSGDAATDIARDLWRMRLAGWFDNANAVLIGRTSAPDEPGFTQEDAVRSVLDDLDVPVVLDVDCGHLPPHLALVNGALADLVVNRSHAEVRQTLIA